MSNHSPLPSDNQIDLAPVDSFGLRPSRHGNQKLLPPTSMPIGPFTTLPTPGPKVLATAKSTEIATTCVADEHNVAAVTSVSAIWAATRHMSLPPKAHAAIATSSALNPDFGLVVHGMERVVGEKPSD